VSWVRRAVRRVTSWMRRDRHTAPPAPDPRRINEARRAAESAGQELNAVRERNPEVEASAASATRLLRENNLGPAFMKALGQRGA
jgi:hypothetical protein